MILRKAGGENVLKEENARWSALVKFVFVMAMAMVPVVFV